MSGAAEGFPVRCSVVADATPARSYRALLALPSLWRVLLGMQIARIAGEMLGIALVLFTLDYYHSAALAGVVTFISIFPGLLVSPIAGALLDRHGRARLVVLDYLVALAALVLIGALATQHALPAALLLVIAACASLTNPLSTTGLRSLFPLLVPRHLWERVNAVDSNGYVLATVIGPPLAGLMVELWGGALAIAVIGCVFGLAALVLLRIPDPKSEVVSTGRLLLDAWQGLTYVWRNPTLRGLGVSISLLNLSGGMTVIVVPLIVLDRLHAGSAAVGAVFAVQGLFGVFAAFYTGRLDSRGRERAMLILTMLVCAGALLLLLPAASLLVVAAALGLVGLANGPGDIALFTLRQRRTDFAWMGRAFAVSMSLNFIGFPIGSALTGWLAGQSVDVAILFGAVACLAGAVAVRVMIPAAEPADQLAT